MSITNIKGLIWTLAVSGFLNVILLTTIFYWIFKEHSPALYCTHQASLKTARLARMPADEKLSRYISHLKLLSFEQLTLKLKSNAVIASLKERDLALACLVSDHFFDLKRALKGSIDSIQEKIVVYQLSNGEKNNLKMFYGLADVHFKQILNFIDEERWPLTTQGLFLLLQKSQEIEDPKASPSPNAPLDVSSSATIKKEASSNSKPVSARSPQYREVKEVSKVVKPASTLPAQAGRLKGDRLYFVEEGDNLWKISQKFKVGIKELKNYNKLSSDELVPNSALRIPIYKE